MERLTRMKRGKLLISVFTTLLLAALLLIPANIIGEQTDFPDFIIPDYSLLKYFDNSPRTRFEKSYYLEKFDPALSLRNIGIEKELEEKFLLKLTPPYSEETKVCLDLSPVECKYTPLLPPVHGKIEGLQIPNIIDKEILNEPDFVLREYRYTPKLLVFWKLGCLECYDQLKELEKLSRRLAIPVSNSIKVIGIVSPSGEGEINMALFKNNAKKHVDDMGITFPVILDVDGKIRNSLDLNEDMAIVMARPDNTVVGAFNVACCCSGESIECLLNSMHPELFEFE